nr:hypothetical protein [Tanacetum cinerariifolium]
MIPPSTHVDTTPIPIAASTIPPSPDYTPASLDYTPASPDYSPASDTESNPSPDHIPPLPANSPFLSSTDDSSYNDIPDTPPSPTHDHFSSDDCLRDSTSSSSSETSSDSSTDALFDYASSRSSSDHSLPAPSLGMRPSYHLCSLMDVDVVRSDGIEIDPEIQAKIDECIAYTNALRDRRIDARVVVEAVDQDEVEMDVRGSVDVRVDRVTHPVSADDIPEPTQEVEP